MSGLPALPEASVIELASDPAAYVIAACERAKAWLADVLDHGRIEQIVELKSQAEAIRVYTIQKQLGKDAELSAGEIVRRAERGIHLAIEAGRVRGEILRPGQTVRRPGHQVSDNYPVKKALADLAVDKLSLANTRQLADSVTDEQFDQAIDEAKSERNLSRANVVRKLRGGNARATLSARVDEIRALARGGNRSAQIAEQLGVSQEHLRLVARREGIDIPADKAVGRARKLDSNRIVREIVTGLEAVETTVALVDFGQLDHADCVGWAVSLRRSMRVLAQLLRRLEGRRKERRNA